MKNKKEEKVLKVGRWGGIFRNYDKLCREWLAERPKDYKKCYCCKNNNPLDEPLYVGNYKVEHNGNEYYHFKILCRKCAYKYGIGVIESDGETYNTFDDYRKIGK